MFSAWGLSAHLADMLAACGWLEEDPVYGGFREVREGLRGSFDS